jgi:hypothetical protein
MLVMYFCYKGIAKFFALFQIRSAIVKLKI